MAQNLRLPARPLNAVAAFIAVLAVAFSGCVDPTSQGLPAPLAEVSAAAPAPESAAPPAATKEPSRPKAFVAPMGVLGCIEVVVFRAVDLAQAQALLPTGWMAAEGTEFLTDGTRVPIGKGLIILAGLHCDDSVVGDGAVDWGAMVIPVEAPRIEGERFDPTIRDVYILEYHTSSKKTRELLRPLGFPVDDALVKAQVSETTPGAATASARDETGTLNSFSVATAPFMEETLLVRFWHESNDGIIYIEHARTSGLIYGGHASECFFRGDSVAAKAFGRTDCLDAGFMGGLFPTKTSFMSTLHWLPGAGVTA